MTSNGSVLALCHLLEKSRDQGLATAALIYAKRRRLPVFENNFCLTFATFSLIRDFLTRQ